MIKIFKPTFIMFCMALSVCAVLNVIALPDASAQEAVQTGEGISGIISDADGPVIGAAVFVKGSSNGVTTGIDGEFSLSDLHNGDIIVVSLIGYESQEFKWTGQSVLDVTLVESSTFLEGVVVTALGIQRQSESLTYSAETVGGKDVNDIKSINMINSLQGKAAGLVITPNSTGAGGSSKILFRGNKSINGSNQPLIVVDGVPVMTGIATSQVSGNYGGERDAGDVLSMINPDDIAQITLLKGASAAALYGAVAANGALMITTKEGQSGKVSVSFSSNTTLETPLSLPEFQNTYGGNTSGTFSWGDKLSSPSPNYLKEFFRTGVTTNNSISVSGGGENYQAYFSYGNVYSQGITPKNDFMSHNLNARVGFTILKKIKLDASAKFSNQHSENQAAAGYLFNPLTGAYLFPRGADWNHYKNNFEVYDAAKGFNVQNWTNNGLQQYSNPYWVLNRQVPISDKYRYEFGGSVKYEIIDGLSIQGRLRFERGEERWRQNVYASSMANYYPYGRFKDHRYFSQQIYGDAIVSYSHAWNNFSLSATAGGAFTETTMSGVELWSEASSLFVSPGNGSWYYPNIFNVANFYNNPASTSSQKKRVNSVFATAQLGFRDAIFLDLTARNDWSSTLAFTETPSYFYPSAGLSLLIDRLADMGDGVDLFKLRGSYSLVGNDVPIYMTNLLYTIGSQGAISAPDKAPFRTLKPEQTTSLEVGFDGAFLNNRLSLGLTYYKTNTRNQFFSVSAPYESGLRNRYVNAGNIQNQGVEFVFGWHEQFTTDFSWETDLNFSYNDNKVKSLVEGLSDGLSIADFGGAKMLMKEGGSYGDLYVRGLARNEDGTLKTAEDGSGNAVPVLGGDSNADLVYAGNLNSKVNASWSNTFRFKDFQLSFLIDARFGGKCLSMTEATLDGWGVSKRSGDARDAGYVEYEGVRFDPAAWYTETGASNFNTNYWNENYVYSATNVRLRELSFGYTFRNVFGKSKNITASIIARNLFFFYKDAPMDPDVSIGTGNGCQGVDIFCLPSTRSFGLNLKLNF